MAISLEEVYSLIRRLEMGNADLMRQLEVKENRIKELEVEIAAKKTKQADA